ncbi:MAG: hypothetical protein K6U03_07150 [Firmicutes bacterium]|nr:hypothetical protein [Bacillota bacterium]
MRPDRWSRETAPVLPARGIRRRWRFHPRGLINLVLLAVLLVNLYVLADGLVRLIKGARSERLLRERLAKRTVLNRLLEEDRDRMAGDDYLREQARRLGFLGPGEVTESTEVLPMVESPIKRQRSRPCPPY